MTAMRTWQGGLVRGCVMAVAGVNLLRVVCQHAPHQLPGHVLWRSCLPPPVYLGPLLNAAALQPHPMVAMRPLWRRHHGWNNYSEAA